MVGIKTANERTPRWMLSDPRPIAARLLTQPQLPTVAAVNLSLVEEDTVGGHLHFAEHA